MLFNEGFLRFSELQLVELTDCLPACLIRQVREEGSGIYR